MADNFLTRKLGPLPTWGWLGIVTAGFGAYYLYEAHKNSTASTSSTSASDVPDYVFQNYNEEPSETPAPTSTSSSSGDNPGGPAKKPAPAKKKPAPKPKPKPKGRATKPARHKAHPATRHPAHQVQGSTGAEPAKKRSAAHAPSRRTPVRKGTGGGVIASTKHNVLSRAGGNNQYERGN